MITSKHEVKTKDIKEVEKVLGIKLVATKADAVVNGYVNYVEKGGKTVTEVVLYQEDEDPTFEVYEKDGVKYSRGHKTTLRKANVAPQALQGVKEGRDII